MELLNIIIDIYKEAMAYLTGLPIYINGVICGVNIFLAVLFFAGIKERDTLKTFIGTLFLACLPATGWVFITQFMAWISEVVSNA